MKRDPGPTNLTFHPVTSAPTREEDPFLPAFTSEQRIPGRRGAAERAMIIRTTDPDAVPYRIEIETEGWYPSKIELNDHQVKRLLAVLKDVRLP